MIPYPKYTTTVIGAHSVPDWYEALDRLLAVGQLSMSSMADAQHRATQAAVLEQELAGIDVITGGEMHRRTHNRHAPPNAMLNHFWQKIPAFQGATKPKPCFIPPRPARHASPTTSTLVWSMNSKRSPR
jgi:5-methyltetrahydropteroyltriglutamate--homocysteine methyltransferase